MALRPIAGVLLVFSVSGCASIPTDMVAYFNGNACPQGWSSVSEAWQGRYVVMAAADPGRLVGEALTPGENRVTGDHSHGPVIIPPQTCRQDNNCARWGDDGYLPLERPDQFPSARVKNAGETIKPGTNAPYVALRACMKT